MTNWFASTSLKKTSWPDSGHLIQRFSGTSRRCRKLRIFGRTTLEIQFMRGLPLRHARAWPGHPRLCSKARRGWPGQAHGRPVRFWWTKCMAWILVGFERFAAFETRTGGHAMRHQNSVFHSLMKHVPWTHLDELVEKFGADELSRKLTTKRHLIALLYGQFSGATSLRA